MDSIKFATFFDGCHPEVRFFIGGAFGFDNEFKNSCNIKLALSAMTMAHPLAKLVLWEQIYRGLTINASHPYHK
jgi:23S rRNA (pseudouridine1915-N3)-methyltransferase